MEFKEFSETMFFLIEMEPVEVFDTTILRDELDIDSLQMVNLATSLADHYQIPFRLFIENAYRMGTVGGLYEIVKMGVSNESVR